MKGKSDYAPFSSLGAIVLCVLVLAGTSNVYAQQTPPPAGIVGPVTTVPPLFVDFSQYWCAASILRGAADPYDPALIAACQRSTLHDYPEVVLQWNPPVTFPFTLAFTALPFEHAKWWWSSLAILMIAASQLVLFRSVSSNSSWASRGIMALGLLLFFPIWECLRFGQISHVLFAGFVVFLLLQFSKPYSPWLGFLAGASLSVTLIKPHLLSLVYVAILIESVRIGRGQQTLGFLVGGMLLGGLPLFLRPSLWIDYTEVLTRLPLYFQTPTIGSMLQSVSGGGRELRFLPMGLGVVSTVWFMSKRPAEPLSRDGVLILSAVSLMISPYGWVYDHLLLLPLVVGVYGAWKEHWQISALMLGVHIVGFPWYGTTEMQWYWWYPVAVLVVFLWSLKNRGITASSTPSVP